MSKGFKEWMLATPNCWDSMDVLILVLVLVVVLIGYVVGWEEGRHVRER